MYKGGSFDIIMILYKNIILLRSKCAKIYQEKCIQVGKQLSL